ncbi:MAG: hypothetical protein Q9225_007388 [Loekoesia sp. 1 TL-2023]
MHSQYSGSHDLLPTQDRLCEACQKILYFKEASQFHLPQLESTANVPAAASESHAHHATENDMRETAQNGCCVCSVLWRRWTTKCQDDPNLTNSPEWSEEEEDEEYDEDSCPGKSGVDGKDGIDNWPAGFSRVEVEGTLDSGYYVSFEMRTRERQTWSGPLERGDHILAPLLDPELPFHTMDFGNSTSSPACWELARHWLEQCQARHKACDIGTEKSFCPTRLIEIKQDSSGYRLRLNSEATNSAVTKYVTLSHCWGAIQPLTLKIENLDELTQNIAFHALPQTFRDAVSATCQLGYQYLWIDSLCIIQDSEEDWLKEAAAMMEVCRHCMLNLSAQDSKDSTEGLFSQHTMRVVKPLVWESKCKGIPNRLFFLCPTKFWKDQVSNSNLSSRAWVMQEKLLAPRVLHFGKQQIFWECQEFRGCESAPGGIGPQIGGGSLAPNLPNQITNYQNKIGNTPPSMRDFLPKDWELVHQFFKFDGYYGPPGFEAFDSFDYIWKEIVQKYTRCSLTKPSDKLIAISGLAKSLQLVYGGEYCAGLWKSAIIGQLVWNVQRGGKQPDVYRAPTWTWASLDGEIRFPITNTARETINQASLESVNITPLTGDTTGHSKTAYYA